MVELGYEGATLSLIAARAKVSKKTIYAKFGGKPGLLRAVLARMADLHMDADVALLNLDDPVEGLYQWVRMILGINQMDVSHAITAIAMREGRRFPEFYGAVIAARKERQQAPLQAYLEGLMTRGVIRQVDCEDVAATILWILAEDMVSAVSSGLSKKQSEAELNEKARRLASFVAHGLIPRE